MNTTIKKITVWLGVVVVIILAILFVWYFFFTRGIVPTQTPPTTGDFDTTNNTVIGTIGVGNQTGGGVLGGVEPTPGKLQKIFKIADGPVVGASFIQTQNPTTTVARFAMADNGHVFDQVVDMPGAVARAVSNTTIPGLVAAQWGASGSAAVLQYLDEQVIKTVYVGLPTTTPTTNTSAVHIQFLPDNISSFAISPDGKSIVYVLVSRGTSGWIANLDGSNQKKLFSLSLTQLLVSWPSQNILLAQTKTAAGMPGMLFSIPTKTGIVEPLVYAPGLSATANPAFTKVIYQTSSGVRTTYSHDVFTGEDTILSFQPIPEKCLWSKLLSTLLYCASPLTAVAPDYLDLWHQGTASVADGIFGFNTQTGASLLAATPGGRDGGTQADIAQIALSIDEKYLLYVTKGDRSLWGVRLTQ